MVHFKYSIHIACLTHVRFLQVTMKEGSSLSLSRTFLLLSLFFFLSGQPSQVKIPKTYLLGCY